MNQRIICDRDPKSIEEDLKAEMDAAIGLHNIAQEEFFRVCISPNRGDPNEVREAAARQSVTREELVIAVMRFNDFSQAATVPEDLKEGTWRDVMLFELKQAVEAYDFIQKKIADFDQRLQALTAALPIKDVGISTAPAEATSGKSTLKQRSQKATSWPEFGFQSELKEFAGWT